MDEEDLAERRADQKLVSEHDEMDILGGTQAEKTRKTGIDDSQKECVLFLTRACALDSPAPRQPDHARARTGHVTYTKGFGGRTYPQEDGLETGSGYRSESDVAATRDSAWA